MDTDNKATPPRGGSLRRGWTRIPRIHAGRVVRQVNEDGCGPACGEMLLHDRGFEIDQGLLSQGLALPVTAEKLARRMTELSPKKWLGAYTAFEDGASWSFVAGLTQERGSWAALLEPQGHRRVGHWVVVDGVSDEGVVWVRDPCGEAYGVPMEEFLGLWHYTMMVIEECP